MGPAAGSVWRALAGGDLAMSQADLAGRAAGGAAAWPNGRCWPLNARLVLWAAAEGPPRFKKGLSRPTARAGHGARRWQAGLLVLAVTVALGSKPACWLDVAVRIKWA